MTSTTNPDVLDRALANYEAGRPLTTPQWKALQAFWRADLDARVAAVNAEAASGPANPALDRDRKDAFHAASATYPSPSPTTFDRIKVEQGIETDLGVDAWLARVVHADRCACGVAQKRRDLRLRVVKGVGIVTDCRVCVPQAPASGDVLDIEPLSPDQALGAVIDAHAPALEAEYRASVERAFAMNAAEEAERREFDRTRWLGDDPYAGS